MCAAASWGWPPVSWEGVGHPGYTAAPARQRVPLRHFPPPPPGATTVPNAVCVCVYVEPLVVTAGTLRFAVHVLLDCHNKQLLFPQTRYLLAVLIEMECCKI
jgi:hypothetical protein